MALLKKAFAELVRSMPNASDNEILQEAEFRDWYSQRAKTLGLDPNPDAPEHFYDYRAAHRAGAEPDTTGHWPSEFKREGHPRMVVNGVSTKTGQRVDERPLPQVPPPPRVGSALDRFLIGVGERGSELWNSLQDLPKIPEAVGASIASYLKGISPEDVATNRPVRDVAGGVAKATTKALEHPYQTADVLSDVVLPHREAVAQMRSGDVAGGAGRLATDAAAVASGLLVGAKGPSGIRVAPTLRNPSPLTDAEMIDAALDAVAKSSGATINRVEGNLAGKSRFAVGQFPERNRKITALTRQELQDFIDANKDLLSAPEHSLGIWKPENEPIDLDVVGTPSKLTEALKIGQRKVKGPAGVLTQGNARPEQAIYDLLYANTEHPEGGNIKVRPELPPWMNALVEQTRGGGPIAGRRQTVATVESQDRLPFGSRGVRPTVVPKQASATVGIVPQRTERLPSLPTKPFPPPRTLDQLYAHGREGANWYDKTHESLNSMLGKERADQLIDMLAATSPNASVRANVTLAIKALEQAESGEEFSGFLGDVIGSLKKAAAGEEFGGLKVRSFAKALKGDPDAVVVDRWVMRAFGFPEGKTPSPKVYNHIADLIRARAKANGVTPREYQAALWRAAKSIGGRSYDIAAPFEDIVREVIQQPSLFNPKGLTRKYPPAGAGNALEQMVVEHRSGKPDLTEIDPSFYNKGGVGDAAWRDAYNYPKEFQKGAFFTRQGGEVEPRVHSLPYTYQGRIDPSLVYDIERDPLQLWPKALEAAKKSGDVSTKHAQVIYLGLVKDAGFDYYHNPQSGRYSRDTIVSLKKVPVTRVK